MTPAILTRLNTARSLLAELRLARSNPNHVPSGPHGGEFAAGKGAARRAKRRKAKLSDLEKTRKAGHKEFAEFRAQHKKERKELVRDQAKAWKAQRREHLKERNALRREHRRDKTGKADRKEAHAGMRADHAHERASLHEDHVTERAGMRQDQHEDRREVLGKIVSDLHDDYPKSKTNRPRPERAIPDSPDRDLAGPGPAPLSRRTTHKAGTAEAILAHCLRRRGWTARYRRGELTGAERLRLLEDVRLYGRAWLRHEAEQFFAAYGVTDANTRATGSGLPASIETSENERPGHGTVTRDDDRGIRSEINRGIGGETGSDGAVARGLGGRIGSAVTRFFDRSRQFIRELIHAAALALKGPAPLTDTDTAYLDAQAAIQADYLRRFESEVTSNPPAVLAAVPDLQSAFTTVQAKPPMSPAQFGARIESYANSAHQAAQKVVRQSVQLSLPAPATQLGLPAPSGPEERRRLGKPLTEHCHDCPPLAAKGWQPLGSLPGIGETECGGLCLCWFEYRNLPGAAPTVNGTAPMKPVRPPRKILLKRTPYTKNPAMQRPETEQDRIEQARLKADFAAKIEAARLKAVAAAAAPKGPPVLEVINAAPTDEEIAHEVKEYLAGRPSRLTVKNVKPREPEPPFELPPGYTWASDLP